MSDPYLIAKWLHILSSTVLFGTGIGTAFQMVWVMRRADPHQVAGVARGVVVADWIFTTPAGIAQPITGIWLIWLAGHDWTAPWLMVSYALYLLAFICWAPVVFLQIQVRDLAAAAVTEGLPLPKKAWTAYRIWFALGWPAFLALTLIYWLMVSKPALWGG